MKDLIPRRDSLEQLSPTDSDPKVGSSPSEGRLELEEAKEEEEEGESYKEDILMGDDQVADFASSVLAAISCWHYKARALLSTHFTTVRVSATHGFPTSCSIPLAYQYPLPLFLPRWISSLSLFFFSHKQMQLTPFTICTVHTECLRLNSCC